VKIYNAFGVLIKSSINLEYIQVESVSQDTDIFLDLGIVNTFDFNQTDVVSRNFGASSWACSPINFYMKIDKIASFSIKNKNYIKIQLDTNVKLESALPFFYGTVLTVLLHMHFRFPLHASAVLGKKGLNLFCAKSGTGKSTLAFNLYQRGYPLFSDDKCVLTWDNILKKYLCKPSIRAIRLWQNSIDNADNTEFLKDGLPVLNKQDKYQFNLDSDMYENLQIVNKIFVIRKVANLKEIKIRPLKYKEKVIAIKNQIHRPGLVIGDEIKKRHHKFVNNIASLIPIYFVQRPENIPIQEFVDFMESKI